MLLVSCIWRLHNSSYTGVDGSLTVKMAFYCQPDAAVLLRDHVLHIVLALAQGHVHFFKPVSQSFQAGVVMPQGFQALRGCVPKNSLSGTAVVVLQFSVGQVIEHLLHVLQALPNRAMRPAESHHVVSKTFLETIEPCTFCHTSFSLPCYCCAKLFYRRLSLQDHASQLLQFTLIPHEIKFWLHLA